MAKILCITSGLTGILNASFELVRHLQNAGHEVIYASPKEVANLVSKNNIPFLKLPAIPKYLEVSIPKFKSPFKKIRRLKHKLSNIKERKKEALNLLYPSAFLSLVKKEKPDLLIIDIELHEYIITAYGKGIKFVLLSQWFSTWKRKGLPYLLNTTIPGKGWRGSSFIINLNWQWIKIKRWWMFSKQKIASGWTDRRSVLLELVKKEKFPMPLIKENYWPGPFSYDQLVVFSMTIKELEFPHDVRPNLHYIGAMVKANRVEKKEQTKNGYTLDEVFEYKDKVKAKLIYCSVSTLHHGDSEFINKVIQAVKNRKDWVVVLSTGGLIPTESFDEIPGNVFVYDFVPQMKVLANADCSINHGGIHTINECVHFKVPMLVYSGKKSDQNGCAARVQFHGLGVMGDKDKDTIKDIQSNIQLVLRDGVYQSRMNVFYEIYESYKTSTNIQKTINLLLSSHQII